MAEDTRGLSKLEQDQWRSGQADMPPVEFVKTMVADAIQTGEISVSKRTEVESNLAREYLRDAPVSARMALTLLADQDQSPPTPQRSGERLVEYYTALKEHLREPEQLGLPETDRRQEVLAFASQWQAEHGAVQSSSTEQRYAAIQDAVATRQATREQAPSLEHAQSRDLGMELS